MEKNNVPTWDDLRLYYLTQKERDDKKRELCEENGIKLFYITKRNYNINEIIDYINGTTDKK